jgi:hypothetical protein
MTAGSTAAPIGKKERYTWASDGTVTSLALA